MIVTLQTAGFFLTIIAGLRFSSWAEKWLASGARAVDLRAPYATPSRDRNIAEPGGGHQKVIAA